MGQEQFPAVGGCFSLSHKKQVRVHSRRTVNIEKQRRKKKKHIKSDHRQFYKTNY